MKQISFTSAIILFFLLLLAPGFVLADKQVTVDRIRWKKGLFAWKDHPDYSEWKNEGNWTEYRKKTYISRYWNPGTSNAGTMMLFIAGQQGSSGSSGCSNCVTGQNETWDTNWGKGDRSKATSIKDLSLAGRLIDSGYFSPYNTFIGIVFNSNFNWGNTPSAKVKAEKAFTNWFLKHGSYNRVERIFLFGSSRGGTLAMRLSKKIKQRSGWNNVPVFVGILDTVPNQGQNELNTSGQPTCTNPLNSNYYSRRADLNAFYNGLVKPKIYHIMTGAPAALGVAVHAFCADASSWYSQRWENLKHTQIGRCVYSEGSPYNPALMETGIVKLYEWALDQI
jgi:hypothetical protein